MTDALEVIDTEVCEEYDLWLKIGMALHHEGTTNGNPDFSDGLRELFHAWSRGSDKYEEEETENKWSSFGDRDDSIKINTLFHYAHQKVANVKNLTREIYPLVDAYSSKREIEKQKQKLTSLFNAPVTTATNNANDNNPPSFRDKKVNINTRMFGYIESVLRPKMRYNLHTGRFEIDGKELKNVDFIKHLSTVLNYSVSQQLFALVHEKYSEETAYHPFEDYLRQLWQVDKNPTDTEVQWAHNKMRYLVTDIMKVKDDEFAITLVRKWLVAMVSRILHPDFSR